MKYGSVCSGIEAATVAWHPLGWEAQWFSEIENFPSAVLAHRFPNVPNLGDMTKIHEHETFKQSAIDVLVGGTPCQSFSVAGLRKGLDDPRGNLMLTFLNIAGRKRPTWVVWENVPGVLSSNEGRDFATFLSGLAELGYGFAYRVLDAQYFGVAQRRRRVFVVGYLGDWRPAAAVLFERHSLSGHPAPRREKREGVAGSVEGGAGNGIPDVSNALCARDHKGPRPEADQGAPVVLHPIAVDLYSQSINHETNQTLSSAASDASHSGAVIVAQPIALAENTIGRKPENGGNGDGFTVGGPMYTLNATGVHGIAQPIAVDWRTTQFDYGMTQTLKTDLAKMSGPCIAQPILLEDQGGSVMNVSDNGLVGTLRAQTHGHEPALTHGTAIRRLTPVECERLQGFPDNHTRIPYRNKPADQCPDGPRYKACGNSMAVPVMRWIGERIQIVNDIL